MSHETDPLRRALHDRADDLHDAPVTLDDVRSRAGGIRRRRRLAAGAGALAVVAVLAPVGIATLGGDDAETPAASEGTTPAPEPVGRVDFTGQGLDRGTGTALPHVSPGQQVVTGGRRVSSARVLQPRDAAPFDGGMVVAGSDAAGRPVVTVRGLDGDLSSKPAPVQDAVTSTSRLEQVAWVEGDAEAQQVALVGAGDGVGDARRASLPIEGGDATAWRPVGIGPDGVVLEDVEGVDGSVVVADPDGGVRPVPGLLRAGGVHPATGRIAGLTSRSDEGSCSAVVGTDGSTAWETCDYTLLGFSPDGRWVLATQPFRSGFGDTSTAVLDAETGALQVEWRADEPEQSATWISRRWESDDTFVAVVAAGNEVSLVRFGVDGSAEHAAEPVTVEDPALDMPYVLPED